MNCEDTEGCDRPGKLHNMCMKHYMRVYRTKKTGRPFLNRGKRGAHTTELMPACRISPDDAVKVREAAAARGISVYRMLGVIVSEWEGV